MDNPKLVAMILSLLGVSATVLLIVVQVLDVFAQNSADALEANGEGGYAALVRLYPLIVGASVLGGVGFLTWLGIRGSN